MCVDKRTNFNSIFFQLVLKRGILFWKSRWNGNNKIMKIQLSQSVDFDEGNQFWYLVEKIKEFYFNFSTGNPFYFHFKFQYYFFNIFWYDLSFVLLKYILYFEYKYKYFFYYSLKPKLSYFHGVSSTILCKPPYFFIKWNQNCFLFTN